MQFYWHGNPIEDIELWATLNRESLLLVRRTIESRPNPFTGLMTAPEIEEIKMPRCFYDSLRIPEGEKWELIVELVER